MKYTIKRFGATRMLQYKHKDNTKILAFTLIELIDTINSYNAIQIKG
jgi:hypothetical protein